MLFKNFNRHQILGLLFLISLVAAVPAQRQRGEAGEQNLRKHVGYLASGQLEGRRTGEQGAIYAAGYIANNFAQFKLRPGVTQTQNGKLTRSFLQPFPVVTDVEIAAAGNEFRLTAVNAANQPLQVEGPAAARLVRFSPNAAAQNVPIVFAGYGIASSELRFDDYKNLDVRGRVVLAFDGTPDSGPNSPWSRYDVRAKALMARERGALGLLLISREADLEKDRTAALQYDHALGEAALPIFVVSRAAAARVLGIREEELKTLENLTALKKDTTLDLKIGFPDTQPRVSFKTNLVRHEARGYNVIGILDGTDPTLKNEAIIIGAHYDHLGRGESLAAGAGAVHHGADDNASGVGALLELARQFAATKRNRRTLIFVAFSGEELGLLGSKFYVNNPVFPLAGTVAMINLDTIGRLTGNKLTVGGIGTAAEWRGLVTRQNATGEANFQPQSAAPGRFVLQFDEDGFGPSDHSSFYGRQIPVLSFFTGTHADYHKPSDTAEKINYPGLLKITGIVGDIVRAIDQGAKRPTYTAAPNSAAGKID